MMFAKAIGVCVCSLALFACRKDRTCQCTEIERIQSASLDSLSTNSWTTDFQDVTKAFVLDKMTCYSSKTIKILPNQVVGYDPITTQPIYEDVTLTNERTCEMR